MERFRSSSLEDTVRERKREREKEEKEREKEKLCRE